VNKRDQLFEGFVRRGRRNHEVDLLETEEPLNAAGEMKVPEMDGIEGSAEDSNVH
jgi:hypothetical protein